jgi:hypothetical protein
LSHTSFQAALLPFLSINSFLSLSGSSDVIRQLFSGEVVGRWVLREWGIHVDRERGRTWPNLTVWEGASEYCSTGPMAYKQWSRFFTTQQRIARTPHSGTICCSTSAFPIP